MSVYGVFSFAHDCIVGDNILQIMFHWGVMHILIIMPIGNSAVQQFTRVGKFAMIGGMWCSKNVIPYGIAHGNRSILQGLNLVVWEEKIFKIKKYYLLLKLISNI